MKNLCVIKIRRDFNPGALIAINHLRLWHGCNIAFLRNPDDSYYLWFYSDIQTEVIEIFQRWKITYRFTTVTQPWED